MSIRWTYHLLPMGKHPSSSEQLQVDAQGQGTHRRDQKNDDPLLGSVGGPVECRGRVPPAMHRTLVELGRAVVTSGACTKGPNKRGMPSTSIHGSHAGTAFGCSVDRDAQAYRAFDTAREQVTRALCK